jgi:hypothetical protein
MVAAQKATTGHKKQDKGRAQAGDTDAKRSGPSRAAAEHATSGKSVSLPIIGQVPLSRDQIGFYAGLGALATVGVIEWPVAAAVGAGHWLLRRSQSGTLRSFGEALDEV